ncbi:MAG: hypothetical protein RLZZ436_4576 [Planctomycetota bacterium]|jgi:hypothetical protein
MFNTTAAWRNSNYLTVLFCLGISLNGSTATAVDPFVFHACDLPVTSLSQHLSLLVDPKCSLTISEIISGEHDLRFVDNEFPIASAGFSTAAVWVRCRIENRCGEDADLLVECSTARLSHADWFIVHRGSLAAAVRCGVSDVPRNAPYVNQYPSIQIELAPDEHLDLFFRAESDTSIWLPMFIGSQRHFDGFSRSRLIRDCFLLAICTMTAAVSLVVGTTARQPMYLSIAIVAASYAITFALFNGHVRAIFPELPIWWERQFYGSLTMFGLLCLVSIDCHVLNLRELSRWIRNTRCMLLLFSATFVILQLILDYRFSAKFLFTYIGLASVFYMVAYACVAIKLRTVPSMIWLVVWLVIVANFAVQQLSQSFVAPYVVQTLILPAILCLFLIGLIRNQIALARTQVRLSTSLQAESEARLVALRSQLEPHFLFNSLNSINALSRIDPGKVPELVGRLAQFLRFRLESNESPFRSLRDEICALEAYVEIEKVRFGSLLSTVFEVRPETESWEVPEMILQPLVENAIKHGFQADECISLTVKSSVLPEQGLLLEVSNRCPESVVENCNGGFGIGITNTRNRLTHLYGDAAKLHLLQHGNVFTASLLIPCRRSKRWIG